MGKYANGKKQKCDICSVYETDDRTAMQTEHTKPEKVVMGLEQAIDYLRSFGADQFEVSVVEGKHVFKPIGRLGNSANDDVMIGAATKKRKLGN